MENKYLSHKSILNKECICTFRSARRETTITSNVYVMFNDSIQECTIMILKDFDQSFYPTVFVYNYDAIEVCDDEIIVKGRFPNKILGRYKVLISPILSI